MKALLLTLVLFLSVNIGLLYYFLFFGEFSQVNQRLQLIERRLDTFSNGSLPDQVTSTATPSAVIVNNLDEQVNLTLVNEIARQVKRDLAEENLDEKDSNFGQISQIILNTEFIPKIFYAPIGQASAKSSDSTWKDTPAEIDFNSENYGQIKSMRFEATLRIPTNNGQVKARLFDTVSGQIVQSEITGEGSDGIYVKSNSFTVPSGERTLRLQILTTLDYEGVVENARIRIERAE